MMTRSVAMKLSALVLLLMTLACRGGVSVEAPGQRGEADAGVARDVGAGPAPCDAGCAEGRRCVDGQCAVFDDDVCEGCGDEACADDEACAASEVCELGQCVAGCRAPADCEVGQTCRRRRCVEEGCAQDSACGSGARCVEGRCEVVGDALCVDDAECGFRWRCSSSAGRCHEGQCLMHADCGEAQWCREGVCVVRRRETGVVRFEPVEASGLSSHEVSPPPGFDDKYGYGGALLDVDGDGRQEVFLGAFSQARDSPPCLYRNISTPGAVRFERDVRLCDWSLGAHYAAVGVDLEGDGRDELVLLGDGSVKLVRFVPEFKVADLMRGVAMGDAARSCRAHSALPVDLDWDGRLDVLVACIAFEEGEGAEAEEGALNLALRQVDGGFEPLSFEVDGPGQTLALGALDVDEDGLVDLLVANDTFSLRDDVPNERVPGGVFRRCEPGRGCDTTRVNFGRGGQAWGSFMGFGNIGLDGSGEHIIIADWGPNRVVRFEEGGPVDVAPELGVEFDFREGFAVFSWGVVVDDFDLNGLDDFFVAHSPFDVDDSDVSHADNLVLQRSGALMEVLSAEVGLPLGSRPFASRGAAKVDFDLDGRMEVLTMTTSGAPRLMRLVPDPQEAPRCTLLPRASVVPAHGHSVALSAGAGEPWRRWDIQGQMSLGLPASVLTPYNEGLLRFPSGAVVSYDCEGGAGPVVVVEPDWVEVSTQEGRVVVRIVEADWLPSDASLSLVTGDGQGVVVEALRLGQTPESWTFELAEGHRRAMVRVGDVWVGRWFTLAERP